MKNILFISMVLIGTSLLLADCTKSNNKPVYTTNCADSLAGVYTGNDYCSGAGQNYTCNILSTTPTNITFSYIGGATNVTAVLNCASNTITIPAQTFPGNISISGTGSYTANRVIVNWNSTSLGASITCSSTFTR